MVAKSILKGQLHRTACYILSDTNRTNLYALNRENMSTAWRRLCWTACYAVPDKNLTNLYAVNRQNMSTDSLERSSRSAAYWSWGRAVNMTRMMLQAHTQCYAKMNIFYTFHKHNIAISHSLATRCKQAGSDIYIFSIFFMFLIIFIWKWGMYEFSISSCIFLVFDIRKQGRCQFWGRCNMDLRKVQDGVENEGLRPLGALSKVV